MEAALRLKEESERRLVVELESVKTQLQDLIQEHTRCIEEQKLIISQNKALTANLGERELGKKQGAVLCGLFTTET